MYYASYKIEEEVKIITLTEEDFHQPQEFDNIPLLYFRITKPLKAEAVLPHIDMNRLFTSVPEF